MGISHNMWVNDLLDEGQPPCKILIVKSHITVIPLIALMHDQSY